MKEGFVFLDEAVPNSVSDARYFSDNNFTGMRVNGYNAGRVVGTFEMAEALEKASDLANKQGLSLLFWDGYRPKRAVMHFVKWAMLPEDGKTKSSYYPNIDKTQLISMGYIIEKSGHSRGSTIDLSLCDPITGIPLDMGGHFDLMDNLSHHNAPGISPVASQNRLLLRRIMEECGFIPYEQEWWHYTLKNEPYPNTYFDFVIE